MEYDAVVTSAGLTPAVIDVDGFALGNQHELTAAPRQSASPSSTSAPP